MKIRRFAPLTLLFALTGCNDETSMPGEDAEECTIDAPTLLMPASASWNLDDFATGFRFSVVDGRLLYNPGGQPYHASDRYLRDLCGGEAERVLSAESGLSMTFTRDSSAGRLLFASDQEGQLYVADRLDVPGADTPRAVGDYPFTPYSDAVRFSELADDAILFVEWSGDLGEQPRAAAGVGARTATLWTYSGEPDEDAALLAEGVVSYLRSNQIKPHNLFTLFDDGRLSWLDVQTLAEEPIRDGVRWARWHWDGERAYALFQAIGDGGSEPVYLRDLQTGEERQVSVNPFADMSFGQDPEHPGTGGWIADVALGLIGPENMIVEAYHPVTLAPLTVPAHVGLSGVRDAPGLVGLVLPDPAEHVRALWDPATGAVTEWYRGPEPDDTTLQSPRWRDGKIVFEEANPDGTERIVEIDVASGERRVVLSQVGYRLAELDDGRIVHQVKVEEPSIDQVVLSDPATGVSKVLIGRTHQTEVREELGLLVYTDLEAETPGLWAMPIPGL